MEARTFRFLQRALCLNKCGLEEENTSHGFWTCFKNLGHAIFPHLGSEPVWHCYYSVNHLKLLACIEMGIDR